MHRHAAPAGQRGPEAPEEVVALLVVGRRGEGATRTWRGSRSATSRLIAPPLPDASQPSNTAHTAARACRAGKAAAREAQLQEALAALLEPCVLLLAAEPQREVELVEPPHQAAPSAPVAGAIELAMRSSMASSRSKSAPSAWR